MPRPRGMLGYHLGNLSHQGTRAWHVDRYDCALACRLPGESTVPGNAEAPRIGGYILVLQRRSIVDHHFSRPASPRNQGTFAGRDHKILDLAAPSEQIGRAHV